MNKYRDDNENSNRDGYIDYLRGTAIILVVIGHAIQNTVNDVDSNWFFRAIYSFHMPLFMFISGLCVYRQSGVYNILWLKKKFLCLVVPFCVWLILPLMVNHELILTPQTFYKAFWNPAVGNWFLISLFHNHFVFYLSRLLNRVFFERTSFQQTKGKVLFIDLIVIILLNFLSIVNTPLNIRNISFYYLFYIVGFYFRKYFDTRMKHDAKYVYVLFSGVLWLLALYTWNRVEDCLVISFLRSRGFIVGNILGHAINRADSYVVALLGIAFWLSLTKLMYSLFEFSMVQIIGQKTLEIYLLHRFFMGILIVNSIWIQVVINVVMGLGISFLIIQLVYRGYGLTLLFGKNRKSK